MAARAAARTLRRGTVAHTAAADRSMAGAESDTGGQPGTAPSPRRTDANRWHLADGTGRDHRRPAVSAHPDSLRAVLLQLGVGLHRAVRIDSGYPARSPGVSAQVGLRTPLPSNRQLDGSDLRVTCATERAGT